MELFWFNPNIHPLREYRSRLDSLKAFGEGSKLPLHIEDNYGLRDFIKKSFAHIDNSPLSKNERCGLCYKSRLERSALKAGEMGFKAFTSTLLISPYQNHGLIKLLGNEIGRAHGLEFVYRDFRPRFRESQSQARTGGFYMQKYCGCIFSEEERYMEGRA